MGGFLVGSIIVLVFVTSLLIVKFGVGLNKWIKNRLSVTGSYTA